MKKYINLFIISKLNKKGTTLPYGDSNVRHINITKELTNNYAWQSYIEYITYKANASGTLIGDRRRNWLL